MTQSLTGFELFWNQYVLTYGAPIIQMALWIVQGVAIVIALRLFKRMVDAKVAVTEAKLGRASAAALAIDSDDPPAGDAADPKARINIEEFVE